LRVRGVGRLGLGDDLTQLYLAKKSVVCIVFLPTIVPVKDLGYNSLTSPLVILQHRTLCVIDSLSIELHLLFPPAEELWCVGGAQDQG